MSDHFAVSKAGHDKGMLYFVLGETDREVFLADGQIRTVEEPKKKNKKHVQIIKNISDDILAKCYLNGKPSNEGIQYALKCYSQNMSGEMEVTY
ncbi:MAG: KOW domain-containing RNA-binding protein [Eubacteriales bacterium]|nr:KOW domain-containing RNA-binding protein [Eubacteriales bacterium]